MRTRRLLLSIVLLLVLVAAIVLLLVKQQWVRDELRLLSYDPPADVAQLATDDQLTEQATRLFYVNRPDIVAKTDFRKYCEGSEQTIVLGCYHGPDRGIYILKIVDDSRLDGVMQVTAAHEMLHAAYGRLSGDEKRQVDGWLMDYYKHNLTDERIQATMEAYKKTEPDALVDEMHSIFGTEVAKLPVQLENYYRRYFTDRSAVTSLAASYQAEFTSREQAIKNFDAQLTRLKGQIDANQADIATQAKQLTQLRANVDQARSSGVQAYNAAVRTYNAAVDRYNTLVDSTKSLISQYNALVEQRNAIATEQQQLKNELSGGNLQTIPK
jgi:hypothetical protein